MIKKIVFTCIVSLLSYITLNDPSHASECLWYSTLDASVSRDACDSKVNISNGTANSNSGSNYFVWTQCDANLCNGLTTKLALAQTDSAVEDVINSLQSDNDENLLVTIEKIKSLLKLVENKEVNEKSAVAIKETLKKALLVLRLNQLDKLNTKESIEAEEALATAAQ